MKRPAASLKTEGKSPHTIRIYATSLSILQRFLERKEYSTDVTRIGPEEIREFIDYLQNTKAFMEHPYTGPQKKGLTGHTINCYLRAIRAFWSWLVTEEIIKMNPFDRIKIPKPPKRIIVPFTDEQIKRLLATVDTHSPIGFRNHTIILTLLDTGLRITELCNLKMQDSNLSDRSLKVLGKGDKERVVPIGGTVQRAIARYLNRSINCKTTFFLPEPVSH